MRLTGLPRARISSTAVGGHEIAGLDGWMVTVRGSQAMSGGFLNHGGTPSSHPFLGGIFPEINHRAIGCLHFRNQNGFVPTTWTTSSKTNWPFREKRRDVLATAHPVVPKMEGAEPIQGLTLVG